MANPRMARCEIGDFIVFQKQDKRRTGVLNSVTNTLGYNQYNVTDLDGDGDFIVHNFKINEIIDSKDIYTIDGFAVNAD